MKQPRGSWVAATAALAMFALTSTATAKRTGMNLACHNCHEGQDKPKVSVALSAARVEAGQALTITVTATHPRAKVGGVLVDSHALGTLEVIDAAGTRLFENTTTQATHAMPQPYVNGQVQFAFRWIAPAMVGTFDLEVWSNAANDNLMPQDDSASEALTAVSVGCDAAWYHVDADKDGAGAELGRVYSCEPMPDRIMQGGDCSDQDPLVHPAVVEACNNIDDNCDGEIDEGFTPVLLVSDGDGDGFGARTGMTKIGCPPQVGYAPNFDDCNDLNPAVNPAALEVSNGIDDNCNGKLDETAPVQPDAPAGPAAANAGGCGLARQHHGRTWPALTVVFLLAWVVIGRRVRGGADASAGHESKGGGTHPRRERGD